jgi:hypothetical protein
MKFLLRVPQHPAKSRIHLKEAPIRPPDGQPEGGILEYFAKPLLAFPEFSLGRKALAHVAGDGGGAHDFAGGISNRRNGEANLDSAAVLLLKNGFQAADAAPSLNGPDALVEFGQVARRGERPRALADHFPARVPEQKFSAPVPTDDRPVPRDAVNCRLGAFHDRCQQRLRLLGFPAPGGVSQNRGDRRYFPSRIPEGASRYRDVDPPPVFAQAQALVLGNGCAGEYLPCKIREGLAPFRWHHRRNVLPNCLSGRVAENRFRPVVPGEDLARGAVGDYGIFRTVHDGRKKRLRFSARPLFDCIRPNRDTCDRFGTRTPRGGEQRLRFSAVSGDIGFIFPALLAWIQGCLGKLSAGCGLDCLLRERSAPPVLIRHTQPCGG